MTPEEVDKKLIEHLSGKKGFVVIPYKPVKELEAFRKERDRVTLQLFLSEEEAVRECSKYDVNPKDIVEYEVLIIPRGVSSAGKVVKQIEENDKKESKVKRATKIKNKVNCISIPKKRKRRTKKEMEEARAKQNVASPAIEKPKRKRRTKKEMEEARAAENAIKKSPKIKKRGRGRPPGSKNKNK